ncbi:hypothetical protein H4R18_003156 [Coemansia javaensis]|uniref:Myb-like domain-containing protein n=1 Tax=Coemansia javaensis TaxID=2761396 RepID=A0A9W8H7T3_9FUNG|nr:hypothetical protein H4R18_003156 [Coemansia javaensis]
MAIVKQEKGDDDEGEEKEEGSRKRTAEMLAAAAKTKQGWYARVTKRADAAYDRERGRIDWELVSAELGLPLIGCLHMFDASVSTVAVRSLPGAGDWADDEMLVMRDFVSANFEALAGDGWRLVGVYMNASGADCLDAYRRIRRGKLTPEMCKVLGEWRGDGMEWDEIHRLHPIWPTSDALRVSFSAHMQRRKRTPNQLVMPRQPDAPRRRSKPKGLVAPKPPLVTPKPLVAPKPPVVPNTDHTVKWTPEENGQMEAIIAEHYPAGGRAHVVRAAEHRFPFRTLQSVRAKVDRILGKKQLLNRILAGQVPTAFVCRKGSSYFWSDDQVARLRSLVAEYGKYAVDWRAVSAELGRSPHACQEKYTRTAGGLGTKRPATAAAAAAAAGTRRALASFNALSTKDKMRIHAIVRKGAGVVPYSEIRVQARAPFVGVERRRQSDTYANYCAARHPVYLARARHPDTIRTVDAILRGAANAGKKANELDIPNSLVHDLLRRRRGGLPWV